MLALLKAQLMGSPRPPRRSRSTGRVNCPLDRRPQLVIGGHADHVAVGIHADGLAGADKTVASSAARSESESTRNV